MASLISVSVTISGGSQVSGCLISGNTAVGNGGGVYSTGSLTLSSCTVELNDSAAYGGAWYKNGGTASLQNCQVRNNAATTVGGVWVQSGGLNVSGGTG